MFLLLPAGRQPELGAGDTCALLLPEKVIRAPVESLGQRKLLIVLQQEPLPNRPLALPTLPVLLPLSTRKPTWQLWHQVEEQVAQCRWGDISQGDAQAAKYLAEMAQDEDLAIFLVWLDALQNSLNQYSTFILPSDTAPWHLMNRDARTNGNGIPMPARSNDITTPVAADDADAAESLEGALANERGDDQ